MSSQDSKTLKKQTETKVAKKPEKESFLQSLKSLSGAILLALAVRFIILEPFHIPSGSMIPNLLVGDYLFVSRFSYGYSKFSLPFGYMLPGLKGRVLQLKEPQYGDVVVFRLPTDQKTDYVKRVIGRPGDRVQLKDGVVHVNDKPLTLTKVGPYEKRAEVNGEMTKGTLFKETLPNGVTHTLLKQVPFGEGTFDDTPVYTVPKGHYFVMGDNRDGSLDSRAMHAIGFIPKDFLIGQAQLIFFSTDDRARWWEVHKWIPSLRLSRFLNFIH